MLENLGQQIVDLTKEGYEIRFRGDEQSVEFLLLRPDDKTWQKRTCRIQLKVLEQVEADIFGRHLMLNKERLDKAIANASGVNS